MAQVKNIDIMTTEPKQFEQEMAMRNIKATMVQAVGPAGGWPVYDLEGTKENLDFWLKNSYDLDDDEISEYYE